ncbi:MerR family DNA-binding transcriptional regulator [Streptomyces platensis]|nr:MerR family DNA-binding transcriptional regulator [Streptomyces platensis]
MLIGELSRRTGVKARLLRYYEAQGLLDVRRTRSEQATVGAGSRRSARCSRVEPAAAPRRTAAAPVKLKSTSELGRCRVRPGPTRHEYDTTEREGEPWSAWVRESAGGRKSPRRSRSCPGWTGSRWSRRTSARAICRTPWRSCVSAVRP